jgi:hypothetical protein
MVRLTKRKLCRNMLGKGCARDPKTRQEKRKQSTNVTTRTHRLTLAHFPTYPQSSSSTSPKKRHLDRSCSQFHREQQWRDPRICLCRCRCLCLFFCLPSPEGNLRLSLFVFSLPFSTAGEHHQTIQSKHPQSHLTPQPKLIPTPPLQSAGTIAKTCQAPNSTKPAPILHKRVAYEFPSIL